MGYWYIIPIGVYFCQDVLALFMIERYNTYTPYGIKEVLQ